MMWYFTPYDFHPPFFYFILMAWTKVFGYSEVALRFPSLIFSLLAGFSVYNIGKKIKSETVGFWAAAFFLFNPLIVYYSQEARMYMMCLYFIVRSYELLLTVENPKERTIVDIVGLNIFIFLSFFTFYGSIFFIFSLYAYLLYKKQFKTLLLTLPGFIISVIVVYPFLSKQLVYAKAALSQVKNWNLVLGKVTLKNFFLIPLKFSIGRISFYPKVLYYSIGLLWSSFVLFFAAKGFQNHKKTAYFLLFPLLVGTLVSLVTPMLQYFRFLYLVPFFTILIAFGSKGKSKYILLTGFVAFSLLYTLFPAFHREDWKSLTRELISKTDTSSSIYGVYSVIDPLQYYTPQIDLQGLDSLTKQKPANKKIFVIPYAADIYGVDYASPLQKYGYKKVKITAVRGLTFEEWVR